MIFSYNWLKELSGTKRTPERLAELLMTHAFEVETVERYPHGLDDIVIGRVLAVEKHKEADRLRVTKVEVGKQEIRTIVCGAPNVAAGQKVAVVLPGGKLPDGTMIKEAAIRGVTSEGMICSERELGLGDAHTGILVLDPRATVGKELAPFLGLDDHLLDVKVLPDRSSDALSYFGLAREISALEGVTAAYLSEKTHAVRRKTSPKVPKVVIKTEYCQRYLLALFKDVTITASPLWLKARLLRSGLRPINGIVDITNYLMLLTGQPMHAFDADAIARGGLVIRQGKAKERLTLLDGRVIHPSKEDMVIADGKKALALAGIMGGKTSGITERTKNVAFEIAHFDPSTVRKTRKRLNLVTDASFRFERGFDLDRPALAHAELLSLMNTLGWGQYVGARDIIRTKEKPKAIQLPLALVESVLGTSVPLFEAVQHLALLGLVVKKVANKKELSVIVPSERIDLCDPWDLVEEIGRTRGYETIPSVAPKLPLVPAETSPEYRFLRTARRTIAAMGYDETMLYSFYSEKLAKTLGLELTHHLRVANPMSPEQALMRSSLLPNLLAAAARNLRHFRSFRLFEIGEVFSQASSRPVESTHIALMSVFPKDDPLDTFLSFKGSIQSFFSSIGVSPLYEPMAKTPGSFHPTRTAVISAFGITLGSMGEIHPTVCRTLGIRERVMAAEIDLAAIMNVLPQKLVATPLRRHPLAYRDISLTGKKSISFAEVQSLLFEAGAPLLVEAELFDVYRDGEETSYAFHLAFGLGDRTIKSSEMDETFDRIVTMASAKLGMRLRLP